MRPDHYKLMFDFVNWAGEQSHIEGIALVGPCADDENEDDANLSFLIITSKKKKTLEAILQLPFEPIEQASQEEYGLLTSIKVVYASGMEADYGVTGEEWLQIPLEEELGAALMSGFKVIWESEELFAGLQRAIALYAIDKEM
jgi:hypothetical protein